MARPRLVVYVSRTGTTAAVAAWLAARLDADLHDLAPRRDLAGLGGLARIAAGALNLSRETAPPITLGGRRLVVLAAPIWFLAPAHPLHEFVRAHRLDGADVLVVLTMTTGCRQVALRRLRSDIEAAGGRCLGVHALKVRPGDPPSELLAPLLSDLHLP